MLVWLNTCWILKLHPVAIEDCVENKPGTSQIMWIQIRIGRNLTTTVKPWFCVLSKLIQWMIWYSASYISSSMKISIKLCKKTLVRECQKILLDWFTSPTALQARFKTNFKSISYLKCLQQLQFSYECTMEKILFGPNHVEHPELFLKLYGKNSHFLELELHCFTKWNSWKPQSL